MYHNFDATGFGRPRRRSIYHGGESWKTHRTKLTTWTATGDDAASATALWLIDVEVRWLQ